MARGKKQGKNKAKASPGKNTPHRAPYKRHSSQSWQVRDEGTFALFPQCDE
ncbi:hypothetical protein A1F94_002718 [Pyrenophora tritici-repentis]|nr:hypothetical protein A1F94_002718 [Pyrenophora tritici-repentis]